jgi:thioesterase domain-containing protein
LINLNGSQAQRVLFAVHALTGFVNVYLPLAREVAAAMRVYGIESVLLQSAHPKRKSVEEMAAVYARDATEIPSGRVSVAGYSFGGVLALETARRLEAAGKIVEAVVMIDSAHPACFTKVVSEAEACLLVAYTLELDLTDSGLHESDIADVDSLFRLARKQGRIGSGVTQDTIQGLVNACLIHSAAFREYDVRPCRARCVLIAGSDMESAELEAWQQALSPGSLEIWNLPLDHFQMMEEGTTEIAIVIRSLPDQTGFEA